MTGGWSSQGSGILNLESGVGPMPRTQGRQDWTENDMATQPCGVGLLVTHGANLWVCYLLFRDFRNLFAFEHGDVLDIWKRRVLGKQAQWVLQGSIRFPRKCHQG